MKNYIKMMPGILVCIAIAVVAKLLSAFIPAIGAVTLAILLGMVAGNLIAFPTVFGSGIRFAEKKILAWAIMLLGLKLQLHVIKDLGLFPLLMVLGVQLVTVITGFIAGKFLRFGNKFSLLMGIGNAVCGSSAIAAVAPVIKAEEDEVGISIGVVNLMGTLGIFLLPAIAHVFTYTQLQGGYFTGGILQAVGQVVAAGFSLGEEAGSIATLIKMVRVLMLGPVVLGTSILFGNTGKSSGKKIHIPPFIIGFVVLSIIGTIFPQDTIIIPHLKYLSKLLLMVAMAAIGMKIRFSDLMRQGPKALLLGTIIFAAQIGFMLLILSFVG